MKKFCVFLALILICGVFPIISGCGKGDNSIYTIDAELDDNLKKLHCKINFDYKNNTDNFFTELRFNFYCNAFREDAKYFPATYSQKLQAGEEGLVYGRVENIVVTKNKKNLPFSLEGTDKTLLIVQLDKEVYPNERYSFNIEYDFYLPKISLRTGYNDSTINLGNFYPILCAYDNGFIECVYYNIGDPFYSQVADYNVSITLDSSYVVASSGELKKEQKMQHVNKFTYVLNDARDFCLVLSKHFKRTEQKVNNVMVYYYYYNDNAPQNALRYAVCAIKTFNENFGKYPYKTYSVVQTPFMQGGMEYPALVYISDKITDSAKYEVIVHETAHQWWYGVVGNNQIEYAFLDEGLTEYSTILFFEKNSEFNVDKEFLMQNCRDTYRTFCSIFDSVYKKVDTTMLRPIPKFISEYEYVCISYIKGCLMFDDIKNAVGEKLFYESLKTYYENFYLKNATPFDLVKVFNKVANLPESYFLAWFNGTAII